MKVFISGPMEMYKDQDYNRAAFRKAEKQLKAQNHEVCNPADLPDVNRLNGI